MADSKDIDTLSSELENRLDDLFGEDNGALPDAEDNDIAAHYPLAELKNLILSIDWEITDDVLEKLIRQIKDLKLTYKHDKIVLTFLQILNSLGDYIKTNRAKSHPKTFKILNSVFASLDKVVLSRDMAETVKKKFLRAEMLRYKELRSQISQGKTAGSPKARAKPAKAEISGSPVIDIGQAPDVVSLREPSIETLAEAVDEIKKYIYEEISALKKEIKMLRNQ